MNKKAVIYARVSSLGDRLAALQSKMDDELANIFTEQNWD